MPPKKKKKKPRSRARGAAGSAAAQPEQKPQSQEKRRERLDARREAKAKAAAQRRRQQQRARVTRLVILFGTLAVIIWFLFIRSNVPDAIAGHEIEHYDTFVSESQANQLHTDGPVTYDEVPPVSGPHSPIPADCGVYGQPLENERMVHTLEHGAVGILYQPDAPEDEIREIESLVQDYESHVFSAPYPNLEDPYTVVAWAHLMRLESYDRAAMEEFIEVFRQAGDAPEEQDCPMGANQPFQPNPTASPTEGPGESPSPERTRGGGAGNDGDEEENNS